MAIAFNQVPNGIKTPGVFVEFDTSRAQQGPSIQAYKALLVGQKLAAGTKAAGSIDLITDASQARQFYGAGSMLSAMVEKFLGENKINELYCIALDDNGSGVAATGSIDIGVTTAVAGTLSVWIAGRRYQAGVAVGDDATDIALALQTAIQADSDRQVTAAINGVDDTIIDLSYRHAGEVGNEIDIRLDSDVSLPGGVSVSITAFSGGSGNPAVTSVVTAMAEEQYHIIGFPYTSATELNVMKTELDDRWGPLRPIDGQLIGCKKASVSSLSTFLDGRNSQHETFMTAKAHRNGPHEIAANLAAIVAREGQNDPARPLQTVALTRLLSAESGDLMTRGERDQILNDGGSTFVSVAGSMSIERLRTTKKLNQFNAPDESLSDLNPKLTLSYLRYDFRTRMAQKFPRHKLANDGVRIAPGQPILTPRIGKAEAVAIFRGWEELGLVEGADQFKRDIIVERNAQDPNRLDFRLPPDLINQLRVVGAQIQFLL